MTATTPIQWVQATRLVHTLSRADCSLTHHTHPIGLVSPENYHQSDLIVTIIVECFRRAIVTLYLWSENRIFD